MKERIITAIVLLVIASAALSLHPITRLMLVFFVYVASNYELLSLVPSLSKQRKIVAVAVLTTIPVSYLLFGGIGLLPSLLIVTTFLLASEVVSIESSVHELLSAEVISIFCIAIIYTGVLGTVPVIAAYIYPSKILFWYIGIIISTDTLAYFGGQLFGGKKLAPRISPKKTVSGGVCGFFAAILFATGAGSYLLPEKSPTLLLAYGALVGALAILGDLVESMLKRAYGAKDTGNILPGHGGVLDRVDALIFASPVLLLLSYSA